MFPICLQLANAFVLAAWFTVSCQGSHPLRNPDGFQGIQGGLAKNLKIVLALFPVPNPAVTRLCPSCPVPSCHCSLSHCTPVGRERMARPGIKPGTSPFHAGRSPTEVGGMINSNTSQVTIQCSIFLLAAQVQGVPMLMRPHTG